MKSVWSDTCEIAGRGPLQGEIRTQAVVIGAGMAGMLTALLLKEKGVDAVVLESQRIGGGVTENTTAKITSQHHLIYDRLIKQLGDDGARQYYLANERAVARFREMAGTRGIDCDFEEKSAFVYSCAETAEIEREVRAVRQIGGQARLVTTLPIPFDVTAAVEFPGQAQFHPLKFLRAIAPELTVYEHSPAKTVKDGVVETMGGRVLADHVVVATHFPFLTFAGMYFMKLHQARSYVLALSGAPQVDGMYIDADTNGISLRNYGELLLFGGKGNRTGENPPQGGNFEALRQAAAQAYPQAREVYSWAAQDCMPMDSVPYIGRYGGEDNVYVATGFQKWGMSSSMAAAEILSDLIADKPNDCAAVFSPQRFDLVASAGNLMKNGAEAVVGLASRGLVPPRSGAEKLAPGHGGIVEYEGKKIGVYKDPDGTIYPVSIKCPHMGCQLEWNPDELSWDCPCHGSRFDFHGAVLDGPAQSGIALE